MVFIPLLSIAHLSDALRRRSSTTALLSSDSEAFLALIPRL